MVLLPQEVDDDEDYNNTDKKSNLTSNKIAQKKDKSKEQNNLDEFMNINIDLTQLPFNKEQENFAIAIAGKTFEMLYYMNQKYESYDENNKDFPILQTNTQREMPPSKLALQPFHEAFRLILRHASVYARCSPDNKTQLVQSLQKEGFQVLMCGDGANDCGALKAADVGVSLSQEEASIAAPFTSTNPDINCIIDVLNQGKCALVTSVEIFKYMIIFSLTEFFAMSLMMFRQTFLFDYQSIAIDVIITLPLCTFLPMTGAYENFNFHRPYSNLASFPIFISVFFQFLLNAIFQIAGYFIMDFYFPNNKIFQYSRKCKGKDEPCNPKKDKHCKDCLDNSMIFYVSFAQYLFSGLVLVTAAPFKKRIYTNITLFIFVIICFFYVFYIIIATDIFSRKYLHLIPFPDDKHNFYTNVKEDEFNDDQLPKIKIPFKYYVTIYCLINFIVCFFFEKVIVSSLIKVWSRKQFNKNEKEIRKIEIEPTLNLINDVKNYVREHEKKKARNKIII
jgi:magnesium-transporting ATPase (P-type)